MKLIPNWENQSLRCHFCGETRSVKYTIPISDPVISNKSTEVCICNKCALKRGANIEQMINDLIEIFDEEYAKRNLITPQNTADKLTAKGYRKSSDVAEEIFNTLRVLGHIDFDGNICIRKDSFDELKKKHTEGK